MNRQIRVPQIRLIGADGGQMGIFSTEGAYKLALEQNLDLVEIDPNSKPPVCKIMDYGRYKYQLQKKKNESKKHQVVVHIKEIKMRPNIDEHDIQFKVNHVRRFLEDKNKAKITVQFKGREMQHMDRADAVFARVIKEIEDVGVVETPPKREGRTLHMIIAPK